MAFVLRGEIDIDGKKGISSLRDVQREATKTSGIFNQSGRSNLNFAKSLLRVHDSASLADAGVGLLMRGGAYGVAIAATYKAAMGLADGFHELGTNAEATGKSIDKAFQAGLSAKSVEGVQSAIDKLDEQIADLNAEAGKFSPFRMIVKGIEKLTSMDLGSNLLEEQAKSAEDRKASLRKTLEQRKQEDKQLRGILQKERALSLDMQQKEIVKRQGVLIGHKQSMLELENANELVRYEEEKLKLAQENLDVVKQRNKEAQDEKAIADAEFQVRKQTLAIQAAETSRAEKRSAIKKTEFQQGASFGAELLGATASGRGALATARRLRAKQVKDENFRLAEQLIPTYRERERIAMTIAESETPTLAERGIALGTNVPAEMLAAHRRGSIHDFDKINEFIRTGGQSLILNKGSYTGGDIAGQLVQPKSEGERILVEIREAMKSLSYILGTAPLVTNGSGL